MTLKLPTKHVLRPGDETLGRELEKVSLEYQFERLIKRADRLGYAVVADSDSVAIRIVSKAMAAGGADLRLHGRKISVHNACGSASGGSGGGGTP